MITIESPAKINWFLYVLKKREDGFHEVISLMQKISLADSMIFQDSDSIRLTDSGSISENSILKAIEAINKFRPLIKRGIHVILDKEIPLSSGLGGGSSNAATAISTLNEMWSLYLSEEELVQVASEVGSDVPFFLGEALSVVRGRGDLLEAQSAKQCFDILLVNPGIEISSKWSYNHIDRFAEVAEDKRIIEDFLCAMNERDFERMKDYMHNTLEGPVLREYPVVKEIKDDLERFGAQVSLMSGSGSTVFGVFEDAVSARNAQERFEGLWSRVVNTIV